MIRIILWIACLFPLGISAQQIRTKEEAKKALYNTYKDLLPCLYWNEFDDTQEEVSIVFYEKHTKECWGGIGDPNTSPRYAGYSIDKYGRIWSEMITLGFEYPAIGYTKKIKTITNIQSWQHPTKKVFAKYGMEVEKVELYADETYPVFFINAFPDSFQNENTFNKFSEELLKANAGWDLSIYSDMNQLKLEGTKRK